MPKFPLTAALDIGTTKVCALLAEVNEQGELVLIGMGQEPSAGIRDGVVVDMQLATEAIANAVDKAVDQAGREVDSVYVGVTGEHIGSMNSSACVAITSPGREITEMDGEKAILAARSVMLPPDRTVIHCIPRFYAIDGQIGVHRPVGMCGTRLEVETHIVHGSTTFLQNVEKCVRGAGLEITEMVLEPVATAESTLMTAERELGVCLLDIGGGTSDIAVFMDGAICYSAVIPIGGTDVTRDVAFCLRTDMEEAERLKLESGCADPKLVEDTDTVQLRQLGDDRLRKLPRKELADIIKARMEELFSQVLKELDRGEMLAYIPAGLVLSGGGSRLAGSAEIAREVMHLPVRIGMPGGVSNMENLQHPMYATAIGLLRYGAREMRSVNGSITSKRNIPRRTPLQNWMKRMMEMFRFR